MMKMSRNYRTRHDEDEEDEGCCLDKVKKVFKKGEVKERD